TRSLYHAQFAERTAYDKFALREVRVGDADNYIGGDAADSVANADAAWRTAVQTASGRTSVGLDVVANSQLVPLTFNFALDPGTYVVGASLSLGFKSAGNNTNGDTIYFENASRTYTWVQLGVTAPGLAQGAAVIDLSKLMAALQDGKLNIAISGNSAIDWATLNLQTASVTQRTTTNITPIDDAYIDQAVPTTNFGSATSLYTKLNGATDNRDSFLKFDLGTLGGIITNAYVRMMPTAVSYPPSGSAGFGTAVGAIFNRLSFVADDTWTESAINWNNKPASDPFFREFISYPNEPVRFDVTSLVRAAQAGDKKLSLRLNTIIDNANSLITFASSENANAGFRPLLVIETLNGINPVADATVRGGTSSTLNFGSDTDLAIKNDTSTSANNDREAFLRFDLSSFLTSPASAFVRMMPFATPAVLQHAAAFVASDTWLESGITWDTRPASSTVMGTWTPTAGAWSQVAATSQAAAAFASDKLLSMKVYSVTESAAAPVQYYSREFADATLRPMLVVSNLAPSITTIPNVPGNLDTPTTARWFGIWDAETAASALTVSATSSNTALLPNANIAFGGSGMDRTFTLTPAAGQFGTATVTVTVTDAQGQSAATTFQYTVVNTIALNGDQTTPNQNDIFKVVRNGAFLDIFRNDMVTPIVHVDYASSPTYAIQSLGGNDQVLIDLAGGNPIPGVGLTIDGGIGNDIVSVIGSSGADAVMLSGGDIVIGSSTTDLLGGEEELHLSLGAGADTLTAGGNASVSTGVVLLNIAGGGSVSMAAASTLPDFTDVVVNGATFNLNAQNQTIDSLTGSGTVTNSGATAATLTVGQAGASSSFAGSLTNGTGGLALTKVGAGTLTLSGANSYTGLSTIAGGTIASGNAASFAALNGQVRFMGGTFRVTANTTAPNFANKFTTSFTGTTAANTATFNIDAGVTLTIGG
ncbi:MAG: hypothetical protein QOE14_820, partial [Humisphaera sp.]|nr:hypothetical protein [Humisphaera sp.]